MLRNFLVLFTLSALESQSVTCIPSLNLFPFLPFAKSLGSREPALQSLSHPASLLMKSAGCPVRNNDYPLRTWLGAISSRSYDNGRRWKLIPELVCFLLKDYFFNFYPLGHWVSSITHHYCSHFKGLKLSKSKIKQSKCCLLKCNANGLLKKRRRYWKIISYGNLIILNHWL